MKKITAGILTILFMAAASAFGADTEADLEVLISKIEKRYTLSGFTARFDQYSTIKSMDITDTAKGKLYIRRPGKMRWEYEKPELQIIISDGAQLWIYRPNDKQVVLGKAPVFFGDGKGISFLSDIKILRENFTASLEPRDDQGNPVIKLIPKKKNPDVELIYMTVSKTTSDIISALTRNAYGDETRIELSGFEFSDSLNPDLFTFTVPPETEIMELEQ
jgi:outer membrane lipoprotein carrier protein